MGLGESEKAVEKRVQPSRRSADAPRGHSRFASAPRLGVLDEILGQSQRQKRGDGACAHGGQVAESAGQSAMADGFGRVPVEAEVAAGDREVGGDGELFAGSETKEGAVVADAELQLWTLGVGCAEANSTEQGQLAEATEMPAAGTFACGLRLFGGRDPGRGGMGGAGMI